MNIKEISIVILLLLIVFLLGVEKFTGFRKDGCGTEIENRDNLFPYIDKSFFVKYLRLEDRSLNPISPETEHSEVDGKIPKLTYDNGDKLFPVNLFA
jgi:hypothetical protein